MEMPGLGPRLGSQQTMCGYLADLDVKALRVTGIEVPGEKAECPQPFQGLLAAPSLVPQPFHLTRGDRIAKCLWKDSFVTHHVF